MKNKKVIIAALFVVVFVGLIIFFSSEKDGFRESSTFSIPIPWNGNGGSFGEIILDYDKSDPEIRKRIEGWYKRNYSEYERLLGGPCQTFHLQVLHEGGGFTNGGGGMFRLTNLGRDTILRANGPLFGRNFEHVFSHELVHAFWNGIWPITRGINAGPSYINEGMAEYMAQAVMQKEINNGDSEYLEQWGLLSKVVTSYDSYMAQADATGKSLYWREQNNFNTNQALAVFAFLEESSPGFLKRFQGKVCGLSPRIMDGGLAIVTSAEELEILMEDAFGASLIEGKNFRSWLRNQPVAETNFESGSSVRFHFLLKNKRNENVIEGSSINPEQIAITKVERIEDQFGGYESTSDVSSEIKITGWDGNIYFPEITDTEEGRGIDIERLSLTPGAYAVEARDKVSGVRGRLRGRTFFIVTKEKQNSEERNLYGIVIDVKGDIVLSGKVRTNDGKQIGIERGVFHLVIPQAESSTKLVGDGWSREVLFPKWLNERLVLIQLKDKK